MSELNSLNDTENVGLNTDSEAKESNLDKEPIESNIETVNNQNSDEELLAELTSGINYEKSKDKYQENMSTAVTFFLFGVAGIVVVILNVIGVLKFFSLKNASGILMCVVLSLMFIIFAVIGIASFIAAKGNKRNAKIEDDNRSKVMDWLSDNVTTDDIESSYNSDDISEEMKYFERSDYIKKSIKAQFPDLGDEFVENITDQYIESNF